VLSELGTDRGGRPRAPAGRSVDHAEQRANRELDPVGKPRPEVIGPRPRVKSDLAPSIALPMPDGHAVASRIEVRFGQREPFLDPQPSAPQHDDQRAQPAAVAIVAHLAHNRHDLIDRGRVGRVQATLVCRLAPGVIAQERGGASADGQPRRAASRWKT
jgi:hypothetical protein